MNERNELLADVRAFLEWQKDCGTEVWSVNNWDLWKINTPPKKNEQHRRKLNEKSIPNATFAKKQPQSTINKTDLNRNINMEQSLDGAWGKLLDNAPKSFDLTTITNDAEGLKRIKRHQKLYCKMEKTCDLGAGKVDSPILILEGHSLGLTINARQMLGKMIDNVLKVKRSKIYWLPYPIDEKCEVCKNLFFASLECISPKLVLIMGSQLKGKIALANSDEQKHPLEIGGNIYLNSKRYKIPGVWTYHPTFLLTDENKKKDSLGHLNNFVGMMRRIGI
jgi:hypothetical protein